jgi:cytochrome o ubiquinol oxidase subunit 2
MKTKVFIALLIILDALLVLWILLHRMNFAVFNPAGTVARGERNLFFFAAGLGLSVVIPTVLATFFIAWKYREDNQKATYTPEWHKNVVVEVIRWSFLCLIIAILAVAMFATVHKLDPMTPIQAEKKPITIQVVALQWKWLFIYPEQHIATVNFVEFPEKTPVDFQLTADAPMNSFWIPQLGGQIYAMSGMVTQRHLIADHAGEYQGVDAEISGEGFASMRFTAKAVSDQDFAAWVQSVQASNKPLNQGSYNELAKPSTATPITSYAPVEKSLYDSIIMKFMPSPTSDKSNTMPGMHM